MHRRKDSIAEIINQSKRQTILSPKIKKDKEDTRSMSVSTSISSNCDCNISMQFLGLDINDLFEFGEYLDRMIKSLRSHSLNNSNELNSISTICLDFWSFYFKSNLNSIIPSLLLYFNKDLSQLSESFFKTLLISVLIGYDCSFNDTLYRSLLRYLNQNLIQLHRVYLILCDFLIHRVKINEDLKLNMIKRLQSKLSMTNPNHLIEMTNVMKSIFTVLKENILSKYMNTPSGSEVLSFYENIDTISVNDIDLFFQGEIKRTNQCIKDNTLNKNDIDKIAYIPLSSIKSPNVNMIGNFNRNNNKKCILPPYKPIKPNANAKANKYYTLVLDMDETLIHFVVDNDLEGKLLYRPYLFEFLKQASQLFEVIVYTASVKEYADIILNLIESKVGHKVFDYRLYREHTTVSNGSSIKDLSRLGRDLSRVVIVDNLAKTFEYQKENGILISSFRGKNKHDRCLLDLGVILSEINSLRHFNNNNDSDSGNDIRVYLKNYSKEILKKVSLKIN